MKSPEKTWNWFVKRNINDPVCVDPNMFRFKNNARKRRKYSTANVYRFSIISFKLFQIQNLFICVICNFLKCISFQNRLIEMCLPVHVESVNPFPNDKF